jgi:hypothetical protein
MAKLDLFAAAQTPLKATTQFIDISDKPTKAKVVREGFEVPTVVLDEKKTTFVLDNLPTVLPRFSPRVVSQSIPPGTKVTPGTVVDLILAPKDAIPFEIFDNVHADLKTRALSHVDDVVENVAVREVLLRRDTASEVTAEEKQLLVTEFQKKGVTVNEADSTRTFARAFDSVRGAAAFR